MRASRKIREASYEVGRREEVCGVIEWPSLAHIERSVVIDESTGCWNWKALLRKGIYDEGYGYLSLRCVVDGTVWYRAVSAHRVVYTLYNSEIAFGLDLDHLCRNTHCVNPDHLEPVTSQENIRRARSYKDGMKDHCPKGHVLSSENVGSSLWQSYCKTCRSQSAATRLVVNKQRYIAIPRDPNKRNQIEPAILTALLAAFDRGESVAEVARQHNFNPVVMQHLRRRYRPERQVPVYVPIPRDPNDRRQYEPSIALLLKKEFERGDSVSQVSARHHYDPTLLHLFKKRFRFDQTKETPK